VKIRATVNRRLPRRAARWDWLTGHIRAIPADGAANRQLVNYVAGCLRVAKSLVSITHGHTGRHKTLEIGLPETDVAPIIAALPLAPQSKLFDE
jgi:uncharacterized protein YggU (UPF0235/DUF167 family)